MLSFIKKYQLLCIIFAVLLVFVTIMAVMIVSELRSQAIDPEDLADILGKETDSADGTDPKPSTAETETEAPLPYFSVEDDMAFAPAAHTGDAFPSVSAADEINRLYTVLPDTDIDAFDDYIRKTAASLGTAETGEDTLREGGTKVISIDYILHTAEHIYSAALVRSVTDTKTDTVEKHVVVRIYDTETNGVFAPLDAYDMTVAAAPLSALMRDGFSKAFSQNNMQADTAFLDTVCTPDPSSFVNIAVDPAQLYFYRIYAPTDAEPTLLCASVPFSALEDYTWEAIEIAKRAEQLPPPEEAPIPVELPTYDISGAVPASEMVEEDYFDDALFIGNSLIVGLQKTVPLNARYFATVGLNVSQVFTKEVIPLTDGTKTTIDHAIELVDFNKVYLMFGVNELGWGSITSFIDYYGKLIDRIREVNPSALVYVQSVLPVNEEKWAKSPDYQSCINNVAVATFNQKIVEMCEDKYAYFVNVAEVLTDETGNLFPEATSDGIHIGAAFSTRWVEYLKTHTVTLQ